VAFHTHISSGDEQQAHWWPQFIGTVSLHPHEQQQQQQLVFMAVVAMDAGHTIKWLQ
jgi:hypothetical protein